MSVCRKLGLITVLGGILCDSLLFPAGSSKGGIGFCLCCSHIEVFGLSCAASLQLFFADSFCGWFSALYMVSLQLADGCCIGV